MTTQDTSRPLALVTGASSGIGAAFAERLGRDRYDLILVARRRDRLDALAQDISNNHSVTVEVFPADLTQPADLQAVESRIAEASELTMLVNNAGFGGYMPFISLEADLAEELIRLQVLAVTRLTRAALPEMIERGRGSIINVSSRLAYSAPLPSPPLPKRATYAASKAYVLVFTQILANELEGTGVRVQALCPGLVKSEFHERVGIDPGQYPPAIVMAPEDLVAASLVGLERGEVICIPSLADSSLIGQIDDGQRLLFEQSRTGQVAERYQA